MAVLSFPLEAGTRGLRRALLHHLVQSRYAAASAGSPAWALRSFDEIHEAAGHACAPTDEHTRKALAELVTLGLVDVTPDETRLRWSATAAGVRAYDREHQLAADADELLAA